MTIGDALVSITFLLVGMAWLVKAIHWIRSTAELPEDKIQLASAVSFVPPLVFVAVSILVAFR